MLAAVSTQNKVLLGGMAAIFIAFALASSFFFPRRDPTFPGVNLRWFLIGTTILFVTMMLTVEFFAVEEEEHGENEEALPALIRL